ncbi:MAG: C4-dicarboxylate transporter DcuC [Gemmatimonadales bacterium]
MALLAGRPLAIADTFTQAMVTAMVAPICVSMGFAALMNATGCDRHLVHALLAPVRRLPWLMVPGGVLAAHLVNMAVPSQASTAAALGPILVPLLLASCRPAAVAGAALVLGASFGGDLLNPGSQDVQAVAGTANRRGKAERQTVPVVPTPVDEPSLRLNPIRAAIPLVPIALLLAGYAGWRPLAWLVAPPPGDEWQPLASALPVVRAMLIGAVLALAVAWREVLALTRASFEGMGSAYASIISLTITAQCFGAGVALIGLADALLRLASASDALVPLAAGFPWALSALSGSGSGPVLAFAQTFLTRVGAADQPVTLGAVACLGGAFGRTMSPVSAVVVYGSGLVGAPPLSVIRRLLPALVAGGAVAIVMALR